MTPIDTSLYPTTPRDLLAIAAATGSKVVVKHATIVAQDGISCVVSTCTRCGKAFPTELRQELTRPGQPIRSIPQCQSCRGRYRDAKRRQALLDEVVYSSVAGKLIVPRLVR